MQPPAQAPGLKPQAASRYVILTHQLPSGGRRTTHWDLMLESGKVLRTWALADPPADEVTVVGEALPDHRTAYLDYEGPVSGDRGSVARWDEGRYEIVEEAAERLTIALDGRRLRGSLTLERQVESHFWRVSFSADPTRG